MTTKFTKVRVGGVLKRVPADEARDTRIAELEAIAETAKATAARAIETCEELRAANDRLSAQRDQAVRNEQAARKAEAETREQFAELKERLHQAEMTNARQQGYIDRVAEDDAAREEPRVINEQRTLPRRPQHVGLSYDGEPCGAMSGMNARSDRPHKHWTGF